MEPYAYFSTMNNSKDKQRLRYAMVMHAKDTSISDAAVQFKTTRVTVRKWVARYDADGYAGLADRSRAPHHCPHKTPVEVEEQVRLLRKQYPWGPERLRAQLGSLPCGISAFKRIVRQRGWLLRKRRKRSQRKRDLRAVKAGWEPMCEFRMDTKYLDDIAAYLPAMRQHGLPQFQYTIREVVTGGMWLAYGHELSMAGATRVVARFLTLLVACGYDLSQVRIQTDWGSEYDGAGRQPRENGYIETIQRLGAQHRAAPPGCPNANADVETVHATIEEEFFDCHRFSSRSDFMQQVTTYQHWYNLRRKNGSKGWRTPLEILEAKRPSAPSQILLLSPILVEEWPMERIERVAEGGGSRRAGVDTMYASLTCPGGPSTVALREHPL